MEDGKRRRLMNPTVQRRAYRGVEVDEMWIDGIDLAFDFCM